MKHIPQANSISWGHPVSDRPEGAYPGNYEDLPASCCASAWDRTYQELQSYHICPPPFPIKFKVNMYMYVCNTLSKIYYNEISGILSPLIDAKYYGIVKIFFVKNCKIFINCKANINIYACPTFLKIAAKFAKKIKCVPIIYIIYTISGLLEFFCFSL